MDYQSDDLHISYVDSPRSRKKEEAEAVGVTVEYIAKVVDNFYGKIRDDALLGPIFAAHITDWPDHLAKMNRFWRAVLHNSDEFDGNPMRAHLAIPGLERRHFDRWLVLFRETLDELEPHPDATRLLDRRARMMAGTLFAAIEVRAGKR